MRRYSRSNGKRRISQHTCSNQRKLSIKWIILLWSIPLSLSGLLLYQIPSLIAQIQKPNNNEAQNHEVLKALSTINQKNLSPPTNNFTKQDNQIMADTKHSETITDSNEQQVALYYCKTEQHSNVAKLVNVKINIDLDKDKIRQMLEKLIYPPEFVFEQGYISLLPEGTKLLDYQLINGLLIINFNYSFNLIKSGEIGNQLKISQIVHSMTSLPEVEKVVFEIEGKKVKYLNEGLIVNRPLGSADVDLQMVY